MATKTTRWRPDTCGCIVEYKWDTEVAPEARTHTYSRTIATCPEHAALAGNALYTEVVSENRRKNLVLGIAQGIDSAITDEGYKWSFDANRVLQASFSGTTPVTRQQIQDACDLQFGPNRVVVT